MIISGANSSGQGNMLLRLPRYVEVPNRFAICQVYFVKGWDMLGYFKIFKETRKPLAAGEPRPFLSRSRGFTQRGSFVMKIFQSCS